MPNRITSLGVPGLRGAASLHIDDWGVTHIRASNQWDLFLAQGYNAARERLWQIDLWRKKGLGLLAADFGPGFLEQDRASRLFLYRGDMEAEWAAYSHPDAKEIATAFVAGINAYIDEVGANPARLPAEFHRMETRPAHWAADDVVRIRSSVLMRNAESELLRGLVMREGGPALDALRRALEPRHVPDVPEGLDLALLREDALDDLKLARAAPTFSIDRMACPLEEAHRWRKLDAVGDVTTEPDPDGSNNWALAGHRTDTGRPIMASDPHRAYTMPSLRYLVHLTAPGIDAIGAGEPTQPGIALGHNGHSAFSLTMLMMDQEDCYVYALSPDDGDRYRYADGWESMRCVDEVIDVKGAPSQTVTLRFTRHGPVVHRDLEKKVAFGVRSVLDEPGGSAYFNSLALLGPVGLDAYRETIGRWGVPAVNHMYADVTGRIAHAAAGKWPRRRNWDGLLPVPGDGRFEWDGFHSSAELPVEIDPPSGVVLSANEWVFARSHDHHARPIGFEFAEASRAIRIRETLGAKPRHGIGDCAALQRDVVSLPARRLMILLRAMFVAGKKAEADRVNPDEASDTASAWRLLSEWDGRLTVSGAAPALFETWWAQHLKPAVLNAGIASLARPGTNEETSRALRRWLAPGDTAGILAALETPAWLGEPASVRRDRLLSDTLGQAFHDCHARFGANPATWSWGDFHHAYFAHPLSPLDRERPAEAGPRASAGPDDKARETWSGDRDVGPLPLPGSGASVAAAAYRLGDGRANFGASFRMVLDVGDWDRSVAINAPGQSGRPDDAHYADLAGPWSAGNYFPLRYTPAAVDAATVDIITLVPEN